MTKRFMTGAKLTSGISQNDNDEILKKAKILIASELLFAPELNKSLEADFKAYVRNLFAAQGLQVNAIIYSNGGDDEK